MLRIDSERLWASIQALAQVGAYRDETTGLMGVNRLALTDADRDGRRLVERWLREAGLEVRIDRIGNTYGVRKGQVPGSGRVTSGSHIDSVPTGGAFDGALGVLGALEVVRTLNDAGIRTDRDLEVGFFTDEEGARFGTDMLGSATACGRLPLEQAYALADKDGRTVKGELERIGYLGTAEARATPPHAYVEVHVEQGPILAAKGLELGLVTGVQAISWFEVDIIGKSAHAGTTPMALRRDAGLIASRINLEMHRMATSGTYGAEMRATMGRFDPVPDRVNIIPGRVTCTIDLRNPDDALMAKAESELFVFIEGLAKETGATITWRQTARTRSVRFAESVIGTIRAKMTAAGHSWEPILSGAGHDAQEFAALCPTAMIFVPGQYDGISHNPREYSRPEDCARGVQILLETIIELTRA